MPQVPAVEDVAASCPELDQQDGDIVTVAALGSLFPETWEVTAKKFHTDPKWAKAKTSQKCPKVSQNPVCAA